MEAIKYLTNWITYLLVLIPAGAGAMVTYQAVRKSLTTDESIINDCNAKIRNTLIGAVIGVTISGFVTLIKYYY